MHAQHRVISVFGATLLLLAALEPYYAESAETHSLQIADGSGWQFCGGKWTENSEGVIRPPDQRNLHSRAIYTQCGYDDFTAEFEWNGDYRETGTGSAGLIIRAQDPNHFYFIYFPWGGQQLRAKHFWAAIAKVEGDGYLRNIAMEWVPSIPSETDRWFKVRVEAKGGDIQVWVDERRALQVHDDRYRSGCVGLAGYGWYAFRNAVINGRSISAPSWPAEVELPHHAKELDLPGDKMPSGCIAPNGDVLLAAGNRLIRSHDKGKTWQPAEELPEKLGDITDYGNGMFCTKDNRLLVMLYHPQNQTEKPTPEILISESEDSGHTWSDPLPAEVAGDWPALPKSPVPYGPVLENENGDFLRFLLGRSNADDEPFTDVRTWGSIHCKAFVIRSTDRGKSWSAPIEVDRPSWVDAERGTIPGSLDFTEPTGVVMSNIVTALIRPIYSPMMWQCWSYDGGATWDAAVRASFPGYAQSMVRTQSGAILCAHRYPHYSVNISRDNGLHWDAGTVIDYPVWAMGCMVEVEPDCVLAVYMNAERNLPPLAQRIKVASDRIEPIP